MGGGENKVKDESEHKSAAGQKKRTKMRTKKRAIIRTEDKSEAGKNEEVAVVRNKK